MKVFATFGVRTWANIIALIVALLGVIGATPIIPALYTPYILLAVSLLNVVLKWLEVSFPQNLTIARLAR